MTQTTTARTMPGQDRVTLADLVERLATFEGPPELFLLELLRVQCALGEAVSGGIIGLSTGTPELIAVYPPLGEGQTQAPAWLNQAIEAGLAKVIKSKAAEALPLQSNDGLYENAPKRHALMVPIKRAGGVHGVAAFLIESGDRMQLAQAHSRLELSIPLLSLYEMRLTLVRRQQDLKRLGQVVELQASFNDQRRMTAAALALCNELTTRFQAERVSVGLLRGRYIKLRAMSHTEKFTRRMQLVQDLEAAMEECLDQDVEIIVPPGEGATYVSRAAQNLSTRHGPTCVVNVPLRRAGKPVGVLTIERPPDQPITVEHLEILRLTADIVTPRLVELDRSDRWFGARLALWLKDGISALMGPQHAWAKLTVIGLTALILFFVFAKGPYRVEAPFSVEPIVRQVVAAPFTGYLLAVDAEPNQIVVKDETMMAKLDTSELVLQLASAKSELVGYEKQADLAERDQKPAEKAIAMAQAEAMRAKIRLLEYQINKAVIKAPISGTVLKGDLKKNLGATVQVGDVMFEIAPVDALRAELLVPEDQITEVAVDTGGDLAAAADPGNYIPYAVERVSPVAEVVNQANVFRVRVRFTRPLTVAEAAWIRPGMEGLAKLEIGQRHYAWIWTRKAVNWLRMKLWI